MLSQKSEMLLKNKLSLCVYSNVVIMSSYLVSEICSPVFEYEAFDAQLSQLLLDHPFIIKVLIFATSVKLIGTVRTLASFYID